ncbi:hypothetical protein HZB00_00170, partial [Candidatus Woesearchaeota archaeon]|nr:hypothetical protein [Candidatus Woesearchaeota archaeon]
SKEKVHQALHENTSPDFWNGFTNYGSLSPETYVAPGDRWACFAVQTDQDFKKERLSVKPVDVLLLGIRLLAFGEDEVYDLLQRQTSLSSEFAYLLNRFNQTSPVAAINPLTRLSGYSAFQHKHPETTVLDYATRVEILEARKRKHEAVTSPFDLDLETITKKCSLRYHLSRGAHIETVIANFRRNDAASRGYGASVLYLKS